MVLILTAVISQFLTLSILLAFVVLEGDVLPRKWAQYLPPVQPALRPDELIWGHR
jgi:hypothetical protein